jgi:hypothetical protein
LKIRGDIRKSRCTTGINDTSGKFATSVNDPGDKFAADTASVVDNGGKFAPGVNDIGGILSSVSTPTAVNLPPASTTSVANNWNNSRLLATLSELGEKYLSIC